MQGMLSSTALRRRRSDHSLENIPLVDIATLYHRK
jgi:hypothetical protein